MRLKLKQLLIWTLTASLAANLIGAAAVLYSVRAYRAAQHADDMAWLTMKNTLRDPEVVERLTELQLKTCLRELWESGTPIGKVQIDNCQKLIQPSSRQP